MYSSVHDLLRWDRELYRDRLLSAPLKRAMFTPGLANYAYGWLAYHLEAEHLDRAAEMLGVTGDAAGLHIIAHGGNIDGFAAAFCRVISHEQVVVLLNNTGLTLPGQMVADILKIMHGQPYSLPKRPAAPELFGITKADGIAEALKNYAAWRADPAGQYDTSLRELLRLARQCAKRGMGEAAVKAFEAAVGHFPDAELAQLELAAYLAKAGQATAAAERYRALLAAKPELPGNVRRRIQTELGRIEGRR
jgi:tetratricopeptide (TPR) repeat protein